MIKIILREWEKEVDRLDAKKSGMKPKQAGESKIIDLIIFRVIGLEWSC